MTTAPMSVREKISAKPWFGAAAAGALLLIGVVVIFIQLSGHSAPAPRDEAFFSTDDGKTWFADGASKVAPFDKDGKQAFRAHVFRSADGKEFVGYLERFKPDAKRALESSGKAPNSKVSENFSAVQSAYVNGREVKRPGDPKWTSVESVRDAAKITIIKSPGGGSDVVEIDP
jgi:hypothetical protein